MTRHVKTFFLLAVFILGADKSLAAKPSVSELLDQLKTAQGDDLIRVIGALGESRSKRAVEPLLAIFDVPRISMPESYAIATALGRLRDADAVPALVEAWVYLKAHEDTLGNSDLSIQVAARYDLLRLAIVDALGQIGGDDAIEVLVAATHDKRYFLMQEHACEALKRLKPNRTGLNCPPLR
jgi:HEAT repeat protein